MGSYRKQRADKSTVWYYDFVHKGIRYTGLGGTKKSQCQRTQAKVLESILNETYEHTQGVQNPKFKDCAFEYLEEYSKVEKKSWKRDQQLINNLNRFFKSKHISQINQSSISGYKIFRKKEKAAPATINRELACLRQIFNMAIEKKYAIKNPINQKMFLKEPPGRTRFLTKEEIKVLLENCDDHIRPVVITALNTGMRLGEILNLTWNCVFLENVIDGPFLEIPVSKSGKKRFIPLNHTMIELFTKLKSDLNESKFVFLKKSGDRISRLERQFKKALENADIKDCTFHTTRHSFASHFLMSGGDLFTLKELLGHSTMEMVQRYSHLDDSHKRKLINNLNYSEKKSRIYHENENEIVAK